MVIKRGLLTLDKSLEILHVKDMNILTLIRIATTFFKPVDDLCKRFGSWWGLVRSKLFDNQRSKGMDGNIFFLICVVIWENQAYWGAHNVFLYQLFPYIYIHRLFLSVQTARKLFIANAHMWQKVQALIRRRAERAASDQSLFFSFLHKPVFHRWRHNEVLIRSPWYPSEENPHLILQNS